MRNRIITCGLAVGTALVLTAVPATGQAIGADGAETQQPLQQATPPPVEAATFDTATAATPPVPAETRYTLAEVAGKPLPVEVEKEWRCREEVTAGTLTLRGDRWRLETVQRETCGDRTEEDRDTDDGIYRTEGGTLRFFDDDGREKSDDWDLDRDLDLDDLRSGTRGADGSLTVLLADGKTRLVFRPEGR